VLNDGGQAGGENQLPVAGCGFLIYCSFATPSRDRILLKCLATISTTPNSDYFLRSLVTALPIHRPTDYRLPIYRLQLASSGLFYVRDVLEASEQDPIDSKHCQVA
jgi:hypothetical protein